MRDYCDTEYELGLMADPANYPFDPEACAETQVMTNVVPIVSTLRARVCVCVIVSVMTLELSVFKVSRTVRLVLRGKPDS